MNTGNNTAGKTAPERYVSEKAFEELPDAFQKQLRKSPMTICTEWILM